MRRYYLHKRGKIYYAELVSQSGVKLSPRSTRTKNRDDAVLVVAEWLKSGIPMGRQRQAKPIRLAAETSEILKALRQADIDADGALSVVSVLRDRGLVDFNVTPAGPGKEKFMDFLRRFWNPEESERLRENKEKGHSITQKYIVEAGRKVEKHWKDYWQGYTLAEVTRSALRKFSYTLKAKGLASKTINGIMNIGSLALSWAEAEGIIPKNPAGGLTGFTG